MSYTSASIVNPEGIPMINLACFSNQGNYRIGELKFYSGDYNQNLLVKQGDLLFACTDMTRDADIIGSPIIVNKEYDSYVFSSDLARITPKTIRKSYLYFAMKNKRFHTYIKRYATGSLVLHLNIDGVNNYPIIIPPIALQVVYSNFFWPLRHIIDENINESNHLTHLRDSLLPMLMNGQVTIE